MSQDNIGADDIAAPVASGHGELPAGGDRPAGPGGLGKTGLFIVNEYGEFLELFRLARHLKKTIGLDAVFLFGRDDYGRLKDHGAMAREQGFKTLSLSWADLRDFQWRQKDAIKNEFGYVPDSIARGSRHFLMSRYAVVLLYLIAWLASAILAIPATLVGVIAAPFMALRWLWHRVRGISTNRYSASLGISPVLHFVRTPLVISRIKRWARHAGAVLKIVEPDIVIMGQDYPGSYNSILTKFSDQKNIKSLIVPFAMYTSKETAESFYYYNDYHLPRGLFARLFKLLLPKWLIRYRGIDIMRLPLSEILALELTGFTMRHPWSPQYSRADLLCQSPHDENYYNKVGIPKQKTSIAGSLWNDTLVKAMQSRAADRKVLKNIIASKQHIEDMRRLISGEGFTVPPTALDSIWTQKPESAKIYLEQEFATHSALLDRITTETGKLTEQNAAASSVAIDRQLKITLLEERIAKHQTEGKRVVVVAWPANQYSMRTVPPYDNYLDFNSRLIDYFSNMRLMHNVDIWVSLHPTLYGVVDLGEFEDKGLHVLKWPLLSFIHCADLFIATVSSTLIWSVQCGIPAVNFDCYDYGYREFAEMGCITVVSQNLFEDTVDDLLRDTGRCETLASDLRQRRDQWTCRDGQSGRRISDAVLQRLT